MANAKLGRPSKEKDSMLRGLVSDLLWFGQVETTVARAKSVKRQAEKMLTLAINSYEDIVKVEKEIKPLFNAITLTEEGIDKELFEEQHISKTVFSERAVSILSKTNNNINLFKDESPLTCITQNSPIINIHYNIKTKFVKNFIQKFAK